MIVVCSRAASRTTVEALEHAGVEVIVASGANEAARVEYALDELGSRDVQSLLLEGGPRLAGAFLEAGEIDEARIFVAPILAGGAQGAHRDRGPGRRGDRRRRARAALAASTRRARSRTTC